MLEIVEFILNHHDDLSTALLLMAIVFSIIISFANYRQKLWEYITNRRNRFHISWLTISAALLFYFEQKSRITGVGLLICVIVWIIYAVTIIISLKPKFQTFTSPVLMYYDRKLKQGEILKNLHFFEKDKYWFLLDKDIQIEYKRLQASYFSSVLDYEKAYRVLYSINQKDLYKEEIIEFDNFKAMFLTQMGGMTAALQLLGAPQDNDSRDPFVWVSYAFIFEQAGNIDKAFEYTRKAKDLADVSILNDAQKAQIYNDYARTALFNGNKKEALQYLRIAHKKAENIKDIRVYEVLVSNLIFNMARAGENRKNCEKILKQYERRIKLQSIDNLVAYNNCALSFYRQIKDDKKTYQLIHSGYKAIIGRLSHSQAEIYKACTFQMLMNGHYIHDWYDGDVISEFDNFKDLDIPIRLQVFKEYMGILQQDEYRALIKRDPYKSLYKNIMQYYEGQAIQEIDECLENTESYDVYKYKNLMLHKLFILKLTQKEKHIEKSKAEYIALSDKLFSDGLNVEATAVLITLIDECSSPYNLLAFLPWWPKPLYYYDFINRVALPPDPEISSDGYHLKYFRLNPNPCMIISPTQQITIEENIDKIIQEFDSWKDHPAKVDMSIEIAHLLLCLDRKDEAKRFYQYYKDTGISDLNFSSWFQNEVKAFEVELKA